MQKVNHVYLKSCPMCGCKTSKEWCPKDSMNFLTVVCDNCELIYIQNPWDDSTLSEFYSRYYSNIHQNDSELNLQREKMYELEMAFLLKFKKGGDVLDVGCSGGQFLQHFKKVGFNCEGVEFGDGVHDYYLLLHTF